MRRCDTKFKSSQILEGLKLFNQWQPVRQRLLHLINFFQVAHMLSAKYLGTGRTLICVPYHHATLPQTTQNNQHKHVVENCVPIFHKQVPFAIGR